MSIFRSFIFASGIAFFATLSFTPTAFAEGPKVLKKVPPDFPNEAARKGITEGVLRASVTIDDKGIVTAVDIVEALPAKAKVFTAAAVDALKQWKFEGNGKAQVTELKLVFQQD